MPAISLCKYWLPMSGAAILAGSSVFAQSPADEFIRRQADQNLEQRLDSLRAVTPDGAEAVVEPPQSTAATGPCFTITRVDVEGVTLLPQTELDPILSPYRNRCIGIADITALLKSLTYLYVDKGYIASRFYVPEQDIGGTKILRLVAAEGALSDIYLNGGPSASPAMLATAFPGMRDKPVNIRDVEQGLDQINRLSSNNAKTSLLPDSTPGASILNVENKPGKPWSLSVANNNLGQKSTGYSQTSASLGMDNLFGLNDFLSLTYQHTGSDYPWPDNSFGQSNSVSGSFSIPYGYWTATLNGSYYRYRNSVPGQFGDIETDGDSRQFGFGIDRVILRDQDSITRLNGGINYKETNNFLLGNRIEVGSRRYTVANFGASHSRRMLGGSWVFDLNYSQGLDM